MSGGSNFSTPENGGGAEKLIGTRVLEFELTAVVGAGGMSVVYRARHRVTAQEVAIKILPPELAIHDELKARFVEEARVLALLEHPNIVSLNNFSEASGRLCLIMQFVDGVTFENKIISTGKVPWQEVMRVGIEVLKALEYAHGQKVIHRDIKPSNVLIRAADSAIKVTDFGIARIIGNTRLTSTGQTMGTVRYMSPEQVRGKSVDARSDIYSLGVTLYEGLTGRTPFEGDNQFDIMQQHLNRKPPALASMSVEVPATVEKALLRALEKDARDRYQLAQEFRVALEGELLRVAPAALAQTGLVPSQPRTLALALGATVAIGGGVALWLALRHPVVLPPEGKPAAVLAPLAAPPKPVWLEPLKLPGIALAVDEKFDTDGVRVQSAGARDAKALRDRYRKLVGVLKEFEAQSGVNDVRKAALADPPPLTLVVVPQALLDKPALWPGYELKPDVNYPSRYVDKQRTLFVSDEADFERRDLPYGVALHAFAPIGTLSTDGVLSLAEKFEAYYNTHGPK